MVGGGVMSEPLVTCCPNCREPVKFHAKNEATLNITKCPLLQDNVRRAIAVTAAILYTRND